MRVARYLIPVILMTLAIAGTAVASGPGGPPRLYERDKAGLDAAEELLIRVAPAAIAANPPVFLVDLPGHGLMEAVRTRFFDYRPDWKSWFGDLRYADNGEGAGSIHVGFHGDRITAQVELEGERYRIDGGPEQGQRLVRLSEDPASRSCGVKVTADPVERLFGAGGVKKADAPFTVRTAALGSVQIDVLAIYPKELFSRANESIEDSLEGYVRDSISLANQAFANNGISASYNLVGVVPLIGSSQPSGSLSSALSWLNGDPFSGSYPQEVRDLRSAFGADVVVLYTRGESDDPCGIANQPASNGRYVSGRTIFPVPMGDRAFSAQRPNCGQSDYTLAHEIGHNYGMGHHDDDPDGFLIRPYARGKVLSFSNGPKATIMGCTCNTPPCAACNRIPYFSDPTRHYVASNGESLPTGDADERDNARIGRDNVAGYAGFYASQSGNAQPRADFTVTCTGRTCDFNASSSYDSPAIPWDQYWWSFGDGTERQGGITTSYTYNFTEQTKTYRVHLVVKDSGGKIAVKAADANPWNPIYEGVHETSNCRNIRGWAWDQVKPNTPINVDIYRDGNRAAVITANLFGQDLLNAGKGNGYHRFDYTPSSTSWRDGRWHTVTVRFSGTSTNLTGTGQMLICGARLFRTQSPTENLSTGGTVYTVGTQFSSNRSGYITELGFHRASGETGTNVLRLWTDGGQELAYKAASCSSSGWCWVRISPVYITAGTRYRVTVNTNTYQSKTGCGIGSGITNDPLTAHSGYWIAGDTFPTGGSCSNFFVDVKFDL